MTVEILRGAVLRRIDEIREKSIRSLRLCRYTPAVGTDKGVVGESSCEGIALHANECNAWIEAMDGVKAIIEDEVRKILQPEQTETPKKKARKELY